MCEDISPCVPATLPSRIVACTQHFRVRARDFYFED
jgi:hypothetical protein